MAHRVMLAFALAGSVALPIAAQNRGGWDGIPPGHLPPPGACRVWYDGVPPGRQPPPTNCRDAERIAARDRRARVIYGRNDPRIDRDSRGVAIPRTVPRRLPSDARVEYPDGRGIYGGDVAFDRGYEDGYGKGREDARDEDRYDPARHGRFRSADRGYERRYGSKVAYQRVYRDGFRAGYDDGYRDYARVPRQGRWPEIRIPWPF
jgi:hypothetical protein